MSERIAKIKEVTGWATGDRRAEAEGRVEAEVANPDDPHTEVTDEAVEEEIKAVREEHGEFQRDRT